MWYRMMIVAFFSNGLCVFGMRVLQDMKLGEYGFLYLAFWYTSGLAVALIPFLMSKKSQMLGREMVIGGLMGLCSSLGLIFLTFALASGLQGYLVFPVAIGGSLSIVTTVGVVVFKERLSVFGYLGVLAGVVGIVLVATPL